MKNIFLELSNLLCGSRRFNNIKLNANLCETLLRTRKKSYRDFKLSFFSANIDCVIGKNLILIWENVKNFFRVFSLNPVIIFDIKNIIELINFSNNCEWVEQAFSSNASGKVMGTKWSHVSPFFSTLWLTPTFFFVFIEFSQLSLFYNSLRRCRFVV